MKPISVYVHWSESPDLTDDRVYPFTQFERKALHVAEGWKSGGYAKTMITVYFDNHRADSTRLDLSPREDKGYQHTLRERETWLRARPVEGQKAGEFLEFFDSIEWPGGNE